MRPAVESAELPPTPATHPSQASVTVRFGQGDWLCLKAPSAAAAAHVADTINARASKRAALRAKAAGGASENDGAAAAGGAAGVAAEASGEA